ncbi:MAG TPA: hypothetical protein VFV50_11175 [Bdellovibrionales bacterium]|nr:hypothetical protein [Bdellovibrionales bacterium]
MKRNSLLVSAALAGLLGACQSTAPKSPEEAEMKSLNEAKVVDAPADAAVTAQTGECHGINACKGKGECGSPTYSCAGNNACKGKGWISMTEADCLKKKGTFKR